MNKLPVVSNEKAGSDEVRAGGEDTSGHGAFVLDGDLISRVQLGDQAGEIAGILRGRAKYVVNLCRCRYRFSLGFAGAILGGLTNLLPANRQPLTVAGVVDNYPDCLVLHDEGLEPELLSALEQRKVATLNLRELPASSDADPALAGTVAPDQCAAIVFTSGSTGEPVAIAKPWGTLAGTTDLLCQRFFAEFLPDNSPSIVATVPPQHMYGLETTVLMALYGRCLVAADHPFFPADIVASLDAVPAPRVLVTTPIHMKSLLRSGLQLPDLELVISATAPLDRALAREVERVWQCRVMEIYGCSEAGSLASRRTATDDEWQLLEGMALCEGDAGVHVSAPHLVGQVPLSDHLDVLAPERFRFLGRSADMLNIAGKRASLAELTAQLQGIEGVSDGIFFLREEGARDVQRLAALVVSERPESDISRSLAGLIDPAFMPRPLKKVDAIPRNTVGKAPRDELLRALREAPAEQR